MKRAIILLSLLAVFAQIHAQNVGKSDAGAIATRFLGTKGGTKIDCVHTEIIDNQTVYYIFNAKNSFVIVSADQRSIPILAYSFECTFNVDTIHPAVQMWLDSYRNQIMDIKSNPVAAPHSLWGRKQSREGITEIKPLLSSYWGQGTCYNYYCPEDDGSSNGHVVTGCVPTAIAQIMYYFRFPESGTGSYSYEEPNYGILSANFAESVYDYEKMVDKPYAINTAISKLIADCGISCDIQYGVDGSGMFNHKAAYALRTFFKYDPQTEYVFRDSVNLDWDSLIVSNLNQKIPLYYAGWSVPNIVGHGFVCDGYQTQDDTNYYFHFNFGWENYADGYFYTDHLNPAGNNFNVAQEVIPTYPDTANYSYTPTYLTTGSRTLTEEAASFTDGSGNLFDAPANMDYTWYIQPQNENISNLILYLHYDLVEGDTLFVSSSDASVSAAYTNTYGSLNEEVDADNLTIRLKTGSQAIRSAGFTASYVSVCPSYCVSNVMHTATSGTVTDRSGANDYLNFTRCKTYILVSGQSAIQLNFTLFDLSEGDYLYIYDRSNGQDTLMMALTGNLGTPTFTLNTARLMLLFVTDESETGEGWEFDYYTGTSAIEEILPLQCNVYPNPAEDELFLELTETPQTVYYQLFDIYGKSICGATVSQRKSRIEIPEHSSGIYFLHITDGTSTTVKKVVLK